MYLNVGGQRLDPVIRGLTARFEMRDIAIADLRMPATVATSFQGNAQAFQASLGSTPILILAALAAVYMILGALYESDPSRHACAASCGSMATHMPPSASSLVG